MHLVWKSIILIVKSLLATNVHCASMVKTSKESIRLRVDGGCSSLRVNLFTLKRRQHSVPDQTGFSCPQAGDLPTPEKWRKNVIEKSWEMKKTWLKNTEKWKMWLKFLKNEEKTRLKNLDLSSILPRKPLCSCDCRLPKVARWGEQIVLVGCFHLYSKYFTQNAKKPSFWLDLEAGCLHPWDTETDRFYGSHC